MARGQPKGLQGLPAARDSTVHLPLFSFMHCLHYLRGHWPRQHCLHEGSSRHARDRVRDDGFPRPCRRHPVFGRLHARGSRQPRQLTGVPCDICRSDCRCFWVPGARSECSVRLCHPVGACVFWASSLATLTLPCNANFVSGMANRVGFCYMRIYPCPRNITTGPGLPHSASSGAFRTSARLSCQPSTTPACRTGHSALSP